jgi:Tetratricopeptide repeat
MLKANASNVRRLDRLMTRAHEWKGGRLRLSCAAHLCPRVRYGRVLAEYPRSEAALDDAMTQNNLGNALKTLGERESGTARLEEAVAAYRAALEENTRDRVPLDWAMTQTPVGRRWIAPGAAAR